MDEDTVTRRRELMRQKAIAKAQMGVKQEELLAKEEEKSGSEEEEDSSEEETESEEEEQEARLKPVFVRAKDRLTIQEREQEELRRTSMAERKADGDTLGIDDVDTEDENDEV